MYLNLNLIGIFLLPQFKELIGDSEFTIIVILVLFVPAIFSVIGLFIYKLLNYSVKNFK